MILGVKLTIWQFLAIILALVVGYCVWAYWGKDQDQNGWIRKFNGGITGDDTSNVKTSGASGSSGGNSAGSSGGSSSGGSDTKNPW